MRADASRVLIVAGGLVPPRWLTPGVIAERLPALARALRTATCLSASSPAPGTIGAPDADLQRDAGQELAHDRWLRHRIGVPVAAGAMTAVRRVADLNPMTDQDGWLIEPVGLQLARDHMVLDTGAAAQLSPADATRLMDAIRPLADDDGYEVSLLSPTAWWLAPRAGATVRAWRLDAVSIEIASGRHVNDWLPQGEDARRFRRLLNEVQMTWYAAHDGALAQVNPLAAINGIWMSGPVTAQAVHAWHACREAGAMEFNDQLLAARIAGDLEAWLDALAAAAPSIIDALTNPDLPLRRAVLLCGEAEARWLDTSGQVLGPASTSPGSTSLVAGLRDRLLRALGRNASPMQASHTIEAMLTEPE